jgi:hypothetical protein
LIGSWSALLCRVVVSLSKEDVRGGGKGGEVKRKDKRSSGVLYHQQAGHVGHAHPSRQQGSMRCMKERETLVSLHSSSFQ